MQHHYDLIIVGAGLAGNCLALALKNSGLSVAVVEAASRRQLRDSPAGDRALALAAGTVRLLEALEAWEGVADKATAIKNIHISDRGHFGKTRLSAAEQDVDALGYVIAARDIEEHLASLVEKTAVTCLYETRVAGVMSGNDAVNVSLKQHNQSLNLTAQLLVGADGGQSTVRKLLDIPQQITEYGQTALVTTVQAGLPHLHTAYERFTAQGPLALLPVAGRQLSVVWTRETEQAEALMASGEAEFMAELQACFGYRLGELKLVAPRRAFPLSLIRAESMVSGRAVIVGNAVHQLHPVAGQGFNLGIRDVAELAERILRQHQNQGDIGNAELLIAYARQRVADHSKTIGFTNNVVRIFSNDWLPVAALRNTGLAFLDHLPFAKKLLAKHAMGLAKPLPKLENI
ncbi:2-octaprenyl-6-methoxyphenyl hydroxylase [Methylomonas methanica]|uniref:2-polyprenyl-6-methoxyphenol 4-hydroxylase n=1 Tax=Methylomonas methanica (strain DSM 25384 / MC09) TaxID=857087 RepID=G0A5U2_METMM|nr:2-octaprenyl-6-methoxyphenyl hydroxylase [Methylomonas methanica]AEF99219.1 2-polyprenyl-6-methoxyphenol 4-hydroxylase [Methylomonas methanica MC09]